MAAEPPALADLSAGVPRTGWKRLRLLAGSGRAVLKFRGNGLEECKPGLGQANRPSFDGASSILDAGGDAGTGGSTALSLCAAGAEVVVSPTGIACGGGVSMTGFGLPGDPSGGFQFLFDIE